jgi:hypothetical protein
MTFTIDDPVAFPPGCLGCQFQVRFKYRSGICNSIQRYQIQIYDIGFVKETCGGCYSDPEPPLDDEDRKQLIFKIAEKILLGKALNIFNEDPSPIFNTTCVPEFRNKISDYIEFWNPACWKIIEDDDYGYRQAFCKFDDCCIDAYKLKALKDHLYSGHGGWGYTIRVGLRTILNDSEINCEYLPPEDDCFNRCDEYRLFENEIIGPWKYDWQVFPPPNTDVFVNDKSDNNIIINNDKLNLSVISEQIGKVDIEIYDITGELIKKISGSKFNKEFLIDDIYFNLSNGIYFLKLSVGSSIYFKKLIKF